ncbi:uncharacterized protein HKW66_Vig0219410 [Vigna angularis]|uniref:Uncharacterized protein n=1 Tax=Phaseolus angularis TaxID=3914 RepID=A0A8T0JG94_PHAAN|nr:uncharacterized protein HKW66_Vig0219410 [Vigna angularis]
MAAPITRGMAAPINATRTTIINHRENPEQPSSTTTGTQNSEKGPSTTTGTQNSEKGPSTQKKNNAERKNPKRNIKNTRNSHNSNSDSNLKPPKS